MPAKRYPLFDVIRGITLISMIAYHGMWDLVNIRGIRVPWYSARPGYLWQQSICWTFILLSGFCIIFSGRLCRRGLTVFGAGLVVTLVTILVLYEDRVVFGVLTLIGSCMLLMIPVRRLTDKIRQAAGTAGQGALPQPMQSDPASSIAEHEVTGKESAQAAGAPEPVRIWVILMIACMTLFVLTRDVNAGRAGLSMLHRISRDLWGEGIPDLFVTLPQAWYRNLLTAYIGFPPASFYSTDYFSLLPWSFMYMAGYFAGLCVQAAGWLDMRAFQVDLKPLSWIGRHSLLIYMLHQPVLYLVIVYALG